MGTVAVADGARPVAAGPRRSALRRLQDAVVAVLGGVVGLAPHVLHHVGPLAGTAVVAGSGGTALFGVLGLVASVPLLLRLQRRFDSWWAPAVGLAAFAAMFALSTLVLGPAISDVDATGTDDPLPEDHDGHHEAPRD